MKHRSKYIACHCGSVKKSRKFKLYKLFFRHFLLFQRDQSFHHSAMNLDQKFTNSGNVFLKFQAHFAHIAYNQKGDG